MKLISKLSEISGTDPLVITVGNFDGLHLGHRKLLEQGLKISRDLKGFLVVITFRPHPQEFFLNLTDFYINNFPERRFLLKELGIEYLIEIDFNKNFSSLSPEEFLNQYILVDHRVKTLFLGHDFSLGKNKSGNLDFIKHFLSKTKVNLKIFPEFLKEGTKVSSSVIRELIRNGNIKKANEMLGREFFISGKVIKGMGKGTSIQIPTVNIEVDSKRLLPKNGVYFTKVKYRENFFRSITNIGTNPTISNDSKIKFETHILDFSNQIYGEDIQVYFLSPWREEKKFKNFEELREQIQTDILARKNFK